MSFRGKIIIGGTLVAAAVIRVTTALEGDDSETVYTTMSSKNKEKRQYHVNISFILLLMISLNVSILTWVTLRLT
jgi:hypothetical protein